MRTSKYLLFTLQNSPINTEIISHKLMLRAGMIRMLSSGLYIWLPIGLRVLKKVEHIIRQEMNNIGFIEIIMPIVQPISLWQKSGRLHEYGKELLKFNNRNNKKFILGPTHEEVITHLVKNEIFSYKELPLNLYQIQTKFRDEMRPQFGIIRSREFLMKDAYSFHIDNLSLNNTYNLVYNSYCNIFKNLGLNYSVTKANTGSIGGFLSHEFYIKTNYKFNIYLNSFKFESHPKLNIKNSSSLNSDLNKNSYEKLKLVNIEKKLNNYELANYFTISVKKTIKIIIVRTTKNTNNSLLALVIRGDHELDYYKIKKLSIINSPLYILNEKEILSTIGINSCFLGPINSLVTLIIDTNVALMKNFIAGANIVGKYFFGINWGRDVLLPKVADLAYINHIIHSNKESFIKEEQKIEIGHIFKLGKKYSKLIETSVQDKYGNNKILNMGCYGIGITRIVAAIIEQYHDNKGIVWPKLLAPFTVAILAINFIKNKEIQKTSERIYLQLKKLNIDVLLDDRDKSPGVMFNDLELIGIPFFIIISDNLLKENSVEYQERCNFQKKIIKINNIIDFLIYKINIKYN